MRAGFLTGLCLGALGLLVAWTPRGALPVCDGLSALASGALVPMRCHWTAQAALGLGAAMAFGGLVLMLSARPGVRLGCSLMLAALCLLVVLTPALLIGVCPGETMPCRMGTAPALYLLGGISVLLSLCVAARSALALEPRRGRGL